MTPKELIDAFEILADAPDGVARLRELVLQFALRGKLVRQDHADEPASVLLKKVAADKARQVKQKKTRRLKDLSPIEAEGVPFPLPNGWEWVRLGELGSIYSGDSIPVAKKRDVYSKVTGGRPYIATKDVGYGRAELEYDNGVRIPSDDSKFKVAEPGAVLVCSEGGSAGRKVGFVRQQICFGNKLIATQPYEGVAPEYLFFFCQSPRFRAAFRERMTGIIGGIALGKFLSIEFPLPPLAEQHRIASRVGELMVLLDRLEAARGSREVTRQALRDSALSALRDADDPETVQSAWTRVANQMEHLFSAPTDILPMRRTILQLAIRGRLVPQVPNDEPVNLLLKRIADVEAILVNKQKITKPKPVSPIEPDEVPFGLPAGWMWVRLQSLVNPLRRISYGVIKLGSDPGGKGIPILRCSDVRWRYIDRAKIRYVEKELSDEYARTVLEGGELVVNIRGTLGGCAVVPADMAGSNIAREVAVVPTVEILPKYLCQVLASPLFQRFTQSSLRGIAYKGLNLSLLRDFLVPVPPFDEQKRIVAKVDELMARCDELEPHLRRAQDAQASFAHSAVGSIHE